MDGFGWLLLKAAIPWLVLLQMIPVMIFLERKGSALIGDRVGPNRAYIPGIGLRMAGMVHNLADAVKLLTKEELIPNQVNRRLYVAAPIIAVIIALTAGAVVPLTPTMNFEAGPLRIQAIDAGIGLLYLLAVASLGVYGLSLAGWASNNKYAQLGGLRGAAQMVSYELAVALGVVGLLMVYGTVDLNEMVLEQGGLLLGFLPRWGIFLQPIGFILLLIGGFAETNRNPFDLAEGESEIIGFHVEYGGIKFGLFFMAEYMHMVVVALLLATCFFGGYQIPYVSPDKLAEPAFAAGMLKVILGAVAVGGLLVGLRLLKWHGRNKKLWHDSRKREGLVLAVLMGFGPAVAAVAAFVLWGGSLGQDGAALTAGVVGFAALMAKSLFFCWLFVWVRWTTPRFRYDQLMRLGWRVLVPLGLINILLTGLGVKLLG